MNTSNEYAIYIGLDVHKETIAVALANPERQGVTWSNSFAHPVKTEYQ